MRLRLPLGGLTRVVSFQLLARVILQSSFATSYICFVPGLELGERLSNFLPAQLEATFRLAPVLFESARYLLRMRFPRLHFLVSGRVLPRVPYQLGLGFGVFGLRLQKRLQQNVAHHVHVERKSVRSDLLVLLETAVRRSEWIADPTAKNLGKRSLLALE